MAFAGNDHRLGALEAPPAVVSIFLGTELGAVVDSIIHGTEFKETGKRTLQIGVDVLPAYRKRNVAAALTSRLAKEILQAGKVPFYCAAWCNLPSVKNALKCGFYPAWTQMTAMPAEFVENFLNGQDKQC